MAISADRTKPDETGHQGMIRRLGLSSRWTRSYVALLLERVSAPLTLTAALIAGFVALGWLGVFAQIGPLARLAVTGLALLLILASLTPLIRIRLPQRDEVSARLDATRPEAHRPLATLLDTPTGQSDPFAAALWATHQRRAADAASKLSAVSGDAYLRRKDPYALRLVAALMLAASAFVAGDERGARLANAFDFTTPVTPPVPPRLDAWIDPPAYTGRPPIFLTGAVTIAPNEVVRAPVGSTLTIRSTSVVRAGETGISAPIELRAEGGLTEPKPVEGAALRLSAVEQPGVTTIRRVIEADSKATVLREGKGVAAFSFGIIPDLPPSATITDARAESASTERQSPAGLRVAYSLEDDYGIAKAELVIERVIKAGQQTQRTLYPAPEATLSLRLGAGEIFLPTEDNPWAGAEVSVRLRVEDDIGQKAESARMTVVLPRRPFTQAIPRALVEQRQNLVLAPDQRQDVVLAFDGLLFEPERFTPNIGEFMALDGLRTGIRNARSDDRLREMVERLYELALHLENGDMSEAERRLREAEARLREALERGAPQNEIRRLAEELRRAMDQFLREFAERALRDPNNQQSQQREPNASDRFLTQRDLQEMLRRIEEMARKGDMAEAQRMLQELRQLLENLRQAQRQNADPRMQELGRQMEELDKLQREQRELRDRTFQQQQQRRQQGQNQQRGQQQQRGRQQPGQQQPGQEGQEGESQEGQNGQQSLEQMQQALRDRLNQLRERLRQRGMQEGEGFGEADQGMGDAGQQLGQGQPGQATEGQQRALDGLGRAQQGMADQLQQQMGEGDGEGEPSGEPGQGQRGRADSRTDPLGRPNGDTRNRGYEDNSRDEVVRGGRALGLGERADKVLQELRKRLGEFERPREELDYLERLLRQR